MKNVTVAVLLLVGLVAPASVCSFAHCGDASLAPDDRVRCLVVASAAIKAGGDRGGGGGGRRSLHLALGDALVAAGRFERAAKVYRAAAAISPRRSKQPGVWSLGEYNPIRAWINDYARRDAQSPQPRVQKWAEYLDAYHRHFAKFRGTAANILEVGVQSGGSLLMWREYFGPRAHIWGVDIDPRAMHFDSPGDNVHVLIGNQGDDAFLASLCATIGRIDVVLDDGSHYNEHQIQLFEALVTKGRCLNMKHGVFVVEDVTTSYMPTFGGGLRAPTSFVEFAKAKVDELNAFWSSPTDNVCMPNQEEIANNCAVAPSLFTGAAASVVFYSGMIIFEMNPRGEQTDTPTRLPQTVDVGTLKVPKWYWWGGGGGGTEGATSLREQFVMPDAIKRVFDDETTFEYNEDGILMGTHYAVEEEREEGTVSFVPRK